MAMWKRKIFPKTLMKPTTSFVRQPVFNFEFKILWVSMEVYKEVMVGTLSLFFIGARRVKKCVCRTDYICFWTKRILWKRLIYICRCSNHWNQYVLFSQFSCVIETFFKHCRFPGHFATLFSTFRELRNFRLLWMFTFCFDV